MSTIKTMRTLTAVTFAAMIATLPVQADARGHGHGGDRVGKLAERLALDEAQREQVEALFEEMRERREALRDEQRERLDELLTDEQRDELAQMRERGRHGRRGRRGSSMEDGSEG